MIFWLFLLQCIYLALPGFFANMAPVMVKNFFKKLAIPIDFNKKWRGKPIFGKNKTMRGFVFGILFALIIAFLQVYLYRYDFFKTLSIIDYSRINFFILGLLMGFGVLFGDLVESFIKRRMDIKPGERFFPWDQIDAIFGGMIFVAPYLWSYFTWQIILTLILLSILLHIIVNNIAYYLKLKETRW